jgi:thioredoxin 1
MTTKHVSDDEFDGTVLGGSGPILVDFWAEWCGPCKQIGPILDEIGKEMEGKLTIAKVNIDQNPESPQRFGVRGIPTMILFKDGKAIGTKVGSMPKGQLVEWLNTLVA